MPLAGASLLWGSNCKVHEIGSQMGSFRLAERTRSLCDEARCSDGVVFSLIGGLLHLIQ